MSFSDLASIGSFVSGVSVLISLVYLSLQVRQTERNQRAILQQGRAARATDTMLRLADGDLAEAHRKSAYGADDITINEVMQFRAAFRAIMLGFEDTYFQHRHDMLDEAAFESTVTSMRASFGTPGYRAAWKLSRLVHDRSFMEFVDRLVGDIAVAQLPEQLAGWKAAVATEMSAADPVP